MAISINWNTKVITIPQADLTFVSGTLYELDVDTFRRNLKDIEDGEGMPFVDTHRHNTEVTIAGVTYARFVEIINGYTVEFEDGQYTVRTVNANHNIADDGILVQNQVSVITNNSAGLATQRALLQRLDNRREITSTQERLYDDDGVTVLKTWTLEDKDGNSVTLNTGDPADRIPD